MGGVFDSTGGSIAGAKVTITDVARGTTRTLTTDSSGQFTAPSLLSGTYTVRAEAAGFQALEQQNVLLEVAQDVRVDLKLTPGATTQTVTVTAEAPAIDTINSTLGGTVSNTEVASLPLVTRNFLDLLQLRPGVVYVPGTPSDSASNGRREGSDVILIEGVTQFDLGTSNVLINGAQKGGAVDTLPLDSIQEFNTQQNPPAEYGWRDGSGVNLAIKSGTNAIHGSAYAFGRDAAATDAKLFSALPGPEFGNNLTVEQPGFTLGGPLVKNKLFWFVSAEFLRQSSISTTGIKVPADATLPSDGSCNLAVGATGSCSLSLFDACQDLIGAGKSFNLLSAQIVGLVPVGSATQPTSCTPSAASSTVENLFAFSNTGLTFPNPATTTPSNNGLAKMDYSPSDKHHFDGFFFISRETTTAGGNYQPFWSTLGVGKTEEYAGAWTYTPNSNWVNELRGGAAPNTGLSIAGDSNAVPSQPWTGPANPTGYSVNTGVATAGLGFMCLNINGIFPSSSTGLGDCGKNGSRGPQYQLDFTDKVSWLHGNHSFKWGYEEVFVRFDDSSTANQNGTVSFTATSATKTAPAVTALENFLLGTSPNSASVIVGNNTDQWREHWHAAFVQDTWRVTPRVTVTPGVRWEYVGSPHSAVNHMGIFDPSAQGGVEQVGPGLPVSTLIHPQRYNFFPRGGVAWDIFGNGKTVLRGGIGLLGSFPSVNTVAGASVPYGATLCTATPCDGNHTANIAVNRFGQPVQTFIAETLNFRGGSKLTWPSNNTSPIFPTASAFTLTTGPSCTPTQQCSFLTVDPNFKYPKSAQWNVDLQRAITNSLTLDVAYVGVHGYDETHSVDLNEPALGSGWTSTAITNCIGSIVAAVSSSCIPDATAEANAKPYNNPASASFFPYYDFIVQTQSGFVSNYNALQVTLTSRGYHGLSFIAAYTLAHALDDWTKNSQATSALANPANPQYQYGNSDFDVRNRFRFSPVYALPGTKKVPFQMAQGWSISAIWALQSGFAWAPNDQTNDDWGGTGENTDNTIPRPNSGVWQSWNYVGPRDAFNGNGDVPIPCYGAVSGCTSFAKAGGAGGSIWQACLAAAQAPYASGSQQANLAEAALLSANGACYMQKGGILTPPAYGTLGDASRGLFVGPDFKNLDITISKMWKFKENYSVTFRAECFNCLNETNINPFSDGSSDPSAGGGSLSAGSTFGFATSGVIQEGGSSNRQFQFGLKLLF